MFIAGTDWGHGVGHLLRDLAADVTQVPFQRTYANERYAKLRHLVQTRHVETIVGHSLGAAVAGEFMRRNPHFAANARLYSWPALGANTDERIQSFAGYGDPVAAGDLSATRRARLNPHGYH